MRTTFLTLLWLAVSILGGAAPGRAAAIILPTPFVVTPGGVFGPPQPGPFSFVYQGTLTGADTLQVTVTGTDSNTLDHCSCVYNAAGFTVSEYHPGQPAGAVAFGNGPEYPFLLAISGVGVEPLLPQTEANGKGSGAPVYTVTLPSTALSALGFGEFSVVDPTLTFMDDFSLPQYAGGSFTVTQDAAVAVPEAGSGWVLAAGLAGVAGWRRRAASRGFVMQLRNGGA